MSKSKTRTSVFGICVLMAFVGLIFLSASASRLPAKLSGSLLARANQQLSGRKQEKHEQPDLALQAFRARFPKAEYDSPEPSNSAEKEKRRNRNKHYDKKRMVMKDPGSSTSGVTEDDELFFDLPALPVSQSDVILTAEILNSHAHLSNTRKAIYSEFDATVDEVFKGDRLESSQTRSISVSRIGGTVRYPSGQEVLYSISGQNMPVTGKRYMFFLKKTEDPDAYEIITAYEVGSAIVLPLDNGANFRVYKNADPAVFLNKLRNAVANQN